MPTLCLSTPTNSCSLATNTGTYLLFDNPDCHGGNSVINIPAGAVSMVVSASITNAGAGPHATVGTIVITWFYPDGFNFQVNYGSLAADGVTHQQTIPISSDASGTATSCLLYIDTTPNCTDIASAQADVYCGATQGRSYAQVIG